MKVSKFSDSQIASILKQAESRPLHNLADHPAEARIMLILSRFA